MSLCSKSIMEKADKQELLLEYRQQAKFPRVLARTKYFNREENCPQSRKI